MKEKQTPTQTHTNMSMRESHDFLADPYLIPKFSLCAFQISYDYT